MAKLLQVCSYCIDSACSAIDRRGGGGSSCFYVCTKRPDSSAASWNPTCWLSIAYWCVLVISEGRLNVGTWWTHEFTTGGAVGNVTHLLKTLPCNSLKLFLTLARTEKWASASDLFLKRDAQIDPRIVNTSAHTRACSTQNLAFHRRTVGNKAAFVRFGRAQMIWYINCKGDGAWRWNVGNKLEHLLWYCPPVFCCGRLQAMHHTHTSPYIWIPLHSCVMLISCSVWPLNHNTLFIPRPLWRPAWRSRHTASRDALLYRANNRLNGIAATPDPPHPIQPNPSRNNGDTSSASLIKTHCVHACWGRSYFNVRLFNFRVFPCFVVQALFCRDQTTLHWDPELSTQPNQLKRVGLGVPKCGELLSRFWNWFVQLRATLSQLCSSHWFTATHIKRDI